MASPQKENGYTPIANELIERFSYPGINGSEHRILWFIIRKTYGYQKKQDRISLSQFQEGTLMNRAQAVKTIKSLVSKKILVKDEGTYKLNKNYDEWIVCKRIPSMQKDTTASMQKDTKSSMQKHTHKRKKETITKETSNQGLQKENNMQNLIPEVIKLFEAVDPKNKTYYGNKTQRAACQFLLDEYGFEEVKKRVEVLPQTNGIQFFPNITTPCQLRDKWVQLENQVKRHQAERETKNNQVIW